MSTQSIPRLIKPVAPEPIGDRIRLTEAQETEVRRIVQEELRDFMLVERRAARLIDSYVAQRLGLNTT